MKKTLLMLFAAAAFVGCDQGGQDVNEPAGADRDMQMERDAIDTNTNSLSDPAGAGATQPGGASDADTP